MIKKIHFGQKLNNNIKKLKIKINKLMNRFKYYKNHNYKKFK